MFGFEKPKEHHKARRPEGPVVIGGGGGSGHPTPEARADYDKRLAELKDAAIAKAWAELPRADRAWAVDAEHNADIAAWQFSCKRHGDFLTLFIERLGAKYSASLNLGLVTGIKVMDGAGPGREVPISWSFSYAVDGEASDVIVWSSFPLGLPPKGHILVANTHLGAPYRPTFVEPQTRRNYGSQMVYGNDWRHDPERTLPAYAEDDRVEFMGIGAAMPVPFGCGAGALDAIHAELERGK